jgi:hypothetical protein
MKRVLLSMLTVIVIGFGGTALAASSGNSANTPGGIGYPVCDRTHSDQCLQLGQNASVDRQLLRSYPQCEKMKGKLQRGTCINEASGVANQ